MVTKKKGSRRTKVLKGKKPYHKNKMMLKSSHERALAKWGSERDHLQDRIKSSQETEERLRKQIEDQDKAHGKYISDLEKSVQEMVEANQRVKERLEVQRQQTWISMCDFLIARAVIFSNVHDFNIVDDMITRPTCPTPQEMESLWDPSGFGHSMHSYNRPDEVAEAKQIPKDVDWPRHRKEVKLDILEQLVKIRKRSAFLFK